MMLQHGSSSTKLIHGPAPPSPLTVRPRLAWQSGAASLQASAEQGHDGLVRALLEHKAQPTQQVRLSAGHAMLP